MRNEVPSNGVATSDAAAESMRPHAVRVLTEVVAYVEGCAAFGATSDEAERILKLSHQTCSARFHQGHRSGLLIRTDRKRPTRSGRDAFVYVYRDYAEPTQVEAKSGAGP